MANFSKLLILIGSIFIFGCSADKECRKILTIPGQTIVSPTGTSVNPDWQMEVPCDYVIPPV